MAEQPQSPVLIKPIPPLVIPEGAALAPFDLEEFFESPNDISGSLRFSAELEDGTCLPNGMICTASGLISGIPAIGTIGDYVVVVFVENDSEDALIAKFTLSIKPRMVIDDPYFLTNFKSQVWQALGQNLPIPDLGDIVNRPLMPVEIYYLLQRFAVLTIWDVYNLEAPSKPVLLKLAEINPHYSIYDKGSCIVAAPNDLFSHDRTLEDALQASRILAREAYKRNWTIEFAGFNKMVRAAWVELQHLGDKHGKKLEILHYTPSPEDLKIYAAQAQPTGPAPG